MQTEAREEFEKQKEIKIKMNVKIHGEKKMQEGEGRERHLCKQKQEKGN